MECQDSDPELKLLKDYMITGQLPEDERKARELVLSKTQYTKRARDPKLSVGDVVFVYFPAKKSGKVYKFARPFQGPYVVQKLFDNEVQVKKIGRSRCKPLQVSLNRVRKSPKELATDEPETTGVKDPQYRSKRSPRSSRF